MILAYSRLGKYDDIRRSVKQIMTFARQFRMDNPLVDFGAKVYQPDQPINLCYDTLGPQAAMIRGLFEYLYDANGMTLVPHIPLTVEKYEQAFPIRLGDKKIFLSTSGSGEIKTVFVNGESWTLFDEHTITLPYERVPAQANIFIALGKAAESAPAMKRQSAPDLLPATKIDTKSDLASEMKTWLVMDSALKEQKLDGGYEAAHCRLGIDSINVIEKRKELKLTPLPEKSQAAADQSYGDTAKKIYDGFDQLMKTYGESQDAQKKKIAQLWADAKKRS